MNKEYFTENISKETLAKLIDETYNYEKNKKTRKIPVSNIIKIVSAATVLVLIFGFINFLPMFVNFDDEINPANEITGDENIYEPVDRGDLFIPEIIEKSFFEVKILNGVKNKTILDKINIYYRFNGSVYKLDASITKREKDMLLDYFLEYTDINFDDLFNMCIDNNLPLPKMIDPKYSHVRFGENEDILLLEIEWHTYDTYLEEMVEAYRKSFDEYKESDDYINSSDEYKINVDNDLEIEMKSLEERLELFKDNDYYSARVINGKKRGISYTFDYGVVDISQYLDKDGYFIWNVYPYKDWVIYRDKDGVAQFKYFSSTEGDYYIYSKKEYDNLLKNEIIPYCDDLLERGLIVQEAYDILTISDPLDLFVDLWFNFD